MRGQRDRQGQRGRHKAGETETWRATELGTAGAAMGDPGAEAEMHGGGSIGHRVECSLGAGSSVFSIQHPGSPEL